MCPIYQCCANALALMLRVTVNNVDRRKQDMPNDVVLDQGNHDTSFI